MLNRARVQPIHSHNAPQNLEGHFCHERLH
nr:MAG TPA: hypothetical protein [Caudoviricetes sp.]